jgi:ATP-dependent DNA helicase DinG
MHLPPPKSPKFRDAVADELAALIEAAGGRTLALFTSWAAMDHAVEAVRGRVGVPILTQRDLPKPALVQAFAESEETCLFATTGMFQGVDVPGRTLSLVVIDKLPFSPHTDPLVAARMAACAQTGRDPFEALQLPVAAIALKQGFGRLIRRRDDRGIVAILDSRVVTRTYGRVFLDTLPPKLPRTSVLEQVRRWFVAPEGEPVSAARSML